MKTSAKAAGGLVAERGLQPRGVVQLDHARPTGPMLSVSFFTHGIPGLSGEPYP